MPAPDTSTHLAKGRNQAFSYLTEDAQTKAAKALREDSHQVWMAVGAVLRRVAPFQ